MDKNQRRVSDAWPTLVADLIEAQQPQAPLLNLKETEGLDLPDEQLDLLAACVMAHLQDKN